MIKLRPKYVTVPGFPTITQLPNWKTGVARGLVAASMALPVDRKEIQRFNETEGKTFEELSHCGEQRYHHLNALMAESLMKILPKPLLAKVQQKELAALKNNCLAGRQVLLMVDG